MAFDGTLKFDTSIDKSGFESGLAKLGSIAKAGMAAVTGAITAASSAMAALGTKALEAYADYEQLTGGVATLFGAQDMSLDAYAESVGKTVDAVKSEYDNLIAAQEAVMGNAAEAFRTAGLSQNEYMETVTSFSAALIASLDGDTAKAAQVADKAIIDMADNANKMGSSMESIQNAYQGFAKQNYTMLDNLKLGYGGTKSEMERLLADAQAISGIEYNLDSYADVVEAIHVIQDKMGITGTTAREAAETISGSVSMTKAAFSNLLVGIADDEQDFEKLVSDLVESATAAAGNILPRVETIIGGIGKLISSMSGVAADMIVNLTAYIPDLVSAGASLFEALADGIAQNAPAVAKSALEIGKELVSGLFSVTSQIGRAATMLLGSLANELAAHPDMLINTATDIITQFSDSIAANLPIAVGAGIRIMDSLVDVLSEVIPKMAEAIADSLPLMLRSGISIISALAESITSRIPDLIEAAKGIVAQLADALVTNLPMVLNAAVQIISALLEALLDPSILTTVLDAALQIILTLAQALLDNIPQIIEILSKLITNVIDFIVEAVPMLLDAAVQLFTAIVDALPQIIDALMQELPKIIDAIVSLIPVIVEAVSDALPKILNALADMIPQVVEAIAKALPQVISAITQALPVIIQALVKALPKIISAVIDALLSCETQLLDAAIQLFDALLEALPVVVETLIPMLPEIITELANVLIEAAPQLFDAGITLFMAIVDAIPEVIDSLVTYFGEMLSIAKEWLGSIFTVCLGIVKTGFSNMIANAKQLASDVVTGAMQFLDELPEKIGHMIGSAIGHIVQFAIDAPAKAKEAASEFLDNVVEFFQELPGKAKEWLDNTIEKVVSWASDLARKGKDGADDLVRKVVDGISVLPQKMFDAGRNLVEGLWNGITGMGDWLRDKISSFAVGIIDGFKDAFGIESPSKVMRDSVGKYLAQGLGVGFTEEIPEIGKAALDAFADLELPKISLKAEIDGDMPDPNQPKYPVYDVPRATNLPKADVDAVRMLRTIDTQPASGLVQPSPTSEVTNNYYTSTTNNRTDSTQPVINVHVHCETEMYGEKVAEMVAEKVDILQGEAITMDERGTAH